MANPDSAIARRITVTPHYRRRARRRAWLFPACLFLAILAGALTLAFVTGTPMADLPVNAMDLVGP
jgi:hypothetical protein